MVFKFCFVPQGNSAGMRCAWGNDKVSFVCAVTCRPFPTRTRDSCEFKKSNSESHLLCQSDYAFCVLILFFFFFFCLFWNFILEGKCLLLVWFTSVYLSVPLVLFPPFSRNTLFSPFSRNTLTENSSWYCQALQLPSFASFCVRHKGFWKSCQLYRPPPLPSLPPIPQEIWFLSFLIF